MKSFTVIFTVISWRCISMLAGWVNALVGGEQRGSKGFMFFIVNVDLTEEGIGKSKGYIPLLSLNFPIRAIPVKHRPPPGK